MATPSDIFTFIWSVENYSMCPVKNGGSIFSPTFVVHMAEKTEWQLQLFPKGNNIEHYLSCCLHREDKEKNTDIIICYSLSLVSVDGSSKLRKEVSSKSFKVGHSSETLFANVDEIIAKKDILLPGDILTLRCRIWREDCQLPSTDIPTDTQSAIITHVYPQSASTLNSTLSEKMYSSARKKLDDLKKHLLPSQCSVRTRIELERRSITWTIDKFREMQVGQKTFLCVNTAMKNTPSFVLELHLSEDVDGDSTIEIYIQRDVKKSTQIFVKCAITVLNAQYEDQDSIEDNHLFEADVEDIWQFPPLMKKSKLLIAENQYLKDDNVLSLRCDFTLSEEEREHQLEGNVFFPEIQNHACSVDNSRNLRKDLVRLRNAGDFCDVFLQSGEQSFPAHKAVLGAVSTVFSDMIKNDFKEHKFEIRDCDPGTLEVLLKYVYSGVLEEMTLEGVMKLYVAALKFQIMDLQKGCSNILRSVLDLSNVCKVLLFADSHHDKVLKHAVIKFISKYASYVFHSSKWKDFMECNIRLAADTMHQVLINK